MKREEGDGKRYTKAIVTFFALALQNLLKPCAKTTSIYNI